MQIMADELSDLSGANKPVEVKVFGPDQKVLALAEQIGEMLEKKGKGRGIKEVSTNVFAGNPDLLVQLDSVKAERHGLKPDSVARQLRAMFLGQIAARAGVVRHGSPMCAFDIPTQFASALVALMPISSEGSGSASSRLDCTAESLRACRAWRGPCHYPRSQR